MPDLIAQGQEAQQRWRRPLPEGKAVVLGRTGGIWAVAWDHQVSRQHVRVRLNGETLEVVRLAGALNPVFFHGKETSRFVVRPGEHFVIGQTTFALADQRANITADGPAPVQQQSFSAQYVREVPFRNGTASAKRWHTADPSATALLLRSGGTRQTRPQRHCFCEAVAHDRTFHNGTASAKRWHTTHHTWRLPFGS